MAEMYKVMLSSTYEELKDHRQAVREAILSQQIFPVAMEDDAALPDQDLIDASLAKVDESDGYVGLISYRYGQTPVCPERNPHCLSLTELEFSRALERKIPICMFIMHDDHPVPKRELEKARVDREKYESFLQLAKKDRIYAEFKSVDDLKAKTVQSLVKLRAALDKRAGASLSPSRDATDHWHGASRERTGYSRVERSEQLLETEIAKTISHPIMLALGAALTWLMAISGSIGSTIAAGVSFLAFSVIYRRYLGILSAGGDPKGLPERDSYERLRASLARGGLAARLFIRRLTKFLDAIDHFFGDTNMADRTLFPHAFGLKTPAPLWTAPAFDRCLFLTLIYPIATIFVFWTASGYVGPAETVLGLKMDVPGWSRGLIAVTSGIVGFATWGLFRGEKQKSAIWKYAAFAAGTNAVVPTAAVIAVSAVAGAVALSLVWGSSGVGAAAFSIAFAASVGSAGRVAGAVSVAVAIPVVFGLALALGGASTVIVISVAGGVAAASLTILLLCAVAIKRGRQGVFLFFFIAAMIVACFATVELMAPLRTWPYTGPLLLFQGLLTLVNTPFNWASVGLTRALLRRGLELGGWWPYLLALVDAIFAAITVTLLALTMVVVIQAFDEFVVYSGGTPVLPLDSLLDGIAKNPAAPQYWWIYALLLASILPSLINLMIGGASLIPGVPGLPTLLLSFMPEGNAVPAFDRTWLSIILTLQIFLGGILGIAAEGFLAVGLIAYIMPAVGLDLLDQALAIAGFDVPARVIQLFASFF